MTYEIPPTIPLTVDGLRNMLIQGTGVAYGRESSDKLIGLFAQEEQIRQWAANHGIELIGYCRDNDVDGKTEVATRAGFSRALNTLETGIAQALIVRHLDRIARKVDVGMHAIEIIWARGQLITCDLGLIPDDAIGRNACLRIFRAAEDEMDALLFRLQSARRQKMARGSYGGGSLNRRYGYQLVEAKGILDYRPIPSEQAVIKRVCAERLEHTYGAIARALNDEGVPTVTGQPWSRKTVRDVARRGPNQLVAVTKADLVVTQGDDLAPLRIEQAS